MPRSASGPTSQPTALRQIARIIAAALARRSRVLPAREIGFADDPGLGSAGIGHRRPFRHSFGWRPSAMPPRRDLGGHRFSVWLTGSDHTRGRERSWRSEPPGVSRIAVIGAVGAWMLHPPAARPRRRRRSLCQQPWCQCRRRSGSCSGTTTRWKVPGRMMPVHPGHTYSLRAACGWTVETVTSSSTSTTEEGPRHHCGCGDEGQHHHGDVERRLRLRAEGVEAHRCQRRSRATHIRHLPCGRWTGSVPRTVTAFAGS